MHALISVQITWGCIFPDLWDSLPLQLSLLWFSVRETSPLGYLSLLACFLNLVSSLGSTWRFTLLELLPGNSLKATSWDNHKLICLFPICHESLFFLFKILFIYSWETQRERGKDIGRERSRLHARSLIWDSILELQDQALNQRQSPHCWATQVSWGLLISIHCSIRV